MIFIGEKLNSSIKYVMDILRNKDKNEILKLAASQRDNGADYIDINAGMFLEQEPEVLAFLAETLSSEGYKLSIDTPSSAAACEALKASAGCKSIINSITLESGRLENMTSLAAEYGCGVVALCMHQGSMPESMETRIKTADSLINYLIKRGIEADEIFIDPMLKPLGADDKSGREALETIKSMRKSFPECHIICGISNLSFGLPKRRLINRAFIVSAIGSGLDAAILDPHDKELMGLVYAAEAIYGLDEYCINYIGKCRDEM